MKRKICQYLLLIFVVLTAFEADAQTEKGLFKMIHGDEARTRKPMRYYEVQCTRKGTVFVSSTVGLIESAGMIRAYPAYLSVDGEKNISRSYKSEDSIKSFCEGIGNCIFFVTHDNKIIWFPYDKNVESWIPSFDFPNKKESGITISKIWSDDQGTLFIGTEKNSFYVVPNGGNQNNFPNTFNEVRDLGEKMEERKSLPVKKIITEDNTGIFCFSGDPINKKHNLGWHKPRPIQI